ncbi:MAG: hypothetical protein RJB38_1894 [Pseudomonadota bacterium]|jgi:hypothetical protein
MIRRHRGSAIFTFAMLGLVLQNQALALPLSSPLPQWGPKSIPQDIPKCDRSFVYQGKDYPCDSARANDGEGLRMLLEKVPSARDELDRYQANRRSLSTLAFTGMAGILIAVMGPRFADSTGSKNLMIAGGLSLTLGSFAFGRSRLAANEQHLDRAIHLFNEQNPEDPISLKKPEERQPPPSGPSGG